MKTLTQTPSQTIGPYFAYGLTPEQYGYDYKKVVDNVMIDPAVTPNCIIITGRVFDGTGNTVDDAMIELWQADAHHQLFGRCGTGTRNGNRFEFYTLKPFSVNGQAPFINAILFMRGQLLHSYTRIYFSDEELLNKTDLVLNAVPEERKSTLIAKKDLRTYVFDIHMQGPKETVFFQI